MSHKRWFSLYDSVTQRWRTEGFPSDNGEPDLNGKQFIGPFKTKRGADFMVSQGALVGSIEDTEEMAKLAATTIIVAQVASAIVVGASIAVAIVEHVIPSSFSEASLKEMALIASANDILRIAIEVKNKKLAEIPLPPSSEQKLDFAFSSFSGTFATHMLH